MNSDEKTAVMSALNKAYRDPTEENKKKYTPKRVKKSQSQAGVVGKEQDMCGR